MTNQPTSDSFPDEFMICYRTWIESICKAHSTTPTDIARKIDASPSTITRQIKPGWTKRPQIDVLRRISYRYETPIPDALLGHVKANKIDPETNVFQTESVGDETLHSGLTAWKMQSSNLEAVGCMVGDTLIFDENTKPRSGDVVLAEIYHYGSPKVDTVARYYLKPYLVGASMGKPTTLPMLVEGEGSRVKILGTLIRKHSIRKSD